jgi:DNA-binding winged helix-turn-helix (wHTH) protein
MSTKNPPLPLTYRAEVLQQVMSDIQAGECCSLIGIDSIGKSNLGRFLQRHDVQHVYWHNQLSWIILIDAHSLVLSEEKAEYSLIELMIQRLIAEAGQRQLADEFLAWSDALNGRLIGTSNIAVALHVLEDLCKRLCEEYGIQLVFVFDQFENLWKTLNAHFFLNLRALRDQFKYQLIYLVMTRDRLQKLREDAQRVEAFWEIFSTHTYRLGPYSEQDTTIMIERLTLRAGIPKEDVPLEVAILSGRHPGLLRAIFWAFRNATVSSMSEESLLLVPSVREECEKIWNSFSVDEQEAIWLIAQGLPLTRVTASTLQDLRFKSVISGEPLHLFSPLFTTYITHQRENTQPGVVVDVRLRQIWLDGQLLRQNLAPLEFRLLEYLARNAGSVCRREELVLAIYGEARYEKHDQRLYAILARLREALGETALTSRYLITHRGGGIQLLQGSITPDEPG